MTSAHRSARPQEERSTRGEQVLLSHALERRRGPTLPGLVNDTRPSRDEQHAAEHATVVSGRPPGDRGVYAAIIIIEESFE